MWQKIKNFFHQNPGLLLVYILVAIILVTSIKPQFFLIGWDNFSTSLNPLLNFPRTFFASWRSYRGFGVPSDSEVTDIFRQLFFLLFSLVLPITLLEQVYFFVCFFIGITAMYFLAKELFRRFQFFSKSFFSETLATFTAVFYLFNLHTLETFYLPIAMYVTRYAFFPLIIYVFLKLLYSPKLTKKQIIYFFAASLLGSAAFLTGTVFVTLLIILGTIVLTNLVLWKRSLFLLIFYLGINSFWIFPFVNYTKEKSNILPLASTFTSVNEMQLNESSTHFSLDKIVTNTPSFFYTKIKALKTDDILPLHPLTEVLLNWSFEKVTLLIIPAFSLLGIILILVKRKRQLSWLPILTITTLFLLRKSYPPLGQIFDYLGNTIPYFKIIFRFGGSKFNPLLTISSCLLAGLGLTQIIFWISRRIPKFIIFGCLFLLLCAYSFSFRSFFSGQFISPQMYVKIPDAYFEISKVINQDSENRRVLHLPMEKLSYWKSYSWGYVGSNFLSYLLNKPLIDRTWEPASLENDQYNQALFEIIQNSQEIHDETEKNIRASQLATLLKNAGIKYIIFDETVSSTVPSRGVNYWGTYPKFDNKDLLLKLVELKVLKETKSYRINPMDYYYQYQPINSLSAELQKEYQNQPPQLITLYEMADHKPIVTAEKSAQVLDNDQVNILQLPLPDNLETKIQSPNESGILYPFTNSLNILDNKQNLFTLPLMGNPQSTYTLNINPSRPPYIVSLSGYQNEKDLIIDFSLYLTPQIGNTKSYFVPLGTLTIPINKVKNYLEPEVTTNKHLSDWHVLDFNQISQLRLRIDNTVIPIPLLSLNKPVNLGHVLVNNPNFFLRVLIPKKNITLPLGQFHFTDDPNCTNDSSDPASYSYQANFTDQEVNISTQDGTTCVIQPLSQWITPQTNYLELSIDVQGTIDERKDERKTDNRLTTLYQKQISSAIAQLPPYQTASVCLVNEAGNCLNTHQNLTLYSHLEKYTIPSSASVQGSFPQLLIKLPSQTETKSTLKITHASLQTFESVQDMQITIPNSQLINYSVNLNSKSELSFPPILSNTSFYFQKGVDGWLVYSKSCDNQLNQYRYSREINSSVLLYQNNCYHGISLPLPFSSNNLTLWRANYSLLSGQFPVFSLKDKNHFYKEQYLSLNQGYPNISGFRSLQSAGPLFWQNKTNFINQALSETAFHTTSTVIYPQIGINDEQEKIYTLEQSTENQGIVIYKDMQIVPLPQSWVNLSLAPDSSQKNFLPAEVSGKQILPSLWKINVQPATEFDTQDSILIVLREAYDRQWQLLGQITPKAKHIKIDGLFNGWEIPIQEINQGKETTFYAFYLPERLAVAGWIATGVVFGLSLAALNFFKKTPKKFQ